jgi:hypothetical protein
LGIDGKAEIAFGRTEPAGSIKDLTGEVVRPILELTGLGEARANIGQKPAGDDRIQSVARSSGAYTFVLA